MEGPVTDCRRAIAPTACCADWPISNYSDRPTGNCTDRIKSSLIGISETSFSMLFANLLPGETITAMEGAGIVLVIAGIIAVTVGPLLQKIAN